QRVRLINVIGCPATFSLIDASLRRLDDQAGTGDSLENRREPAPPLEHRVQLTLRYPHALETAKEPAQARPRVDADEPLTIVGGVIEPPRHDVGHRPCCQLAVLHAALPHER